MSIERNIVKCLGAGTDGEVWGVGSPVATGTEEATKSEGWSTSGRRALFEWSPEAAPCSPQGSATWCVVLSGFKGTRPGHKQTNKQTNSFIFDSVEGDRVEWVFPPPLNSPEAILELVFFPLHSAMGRVQGKEHELQDPSCSQVPSSSVSPRTLLPAPHFLIRTVHRIVSVSQWFLKIN